MPDWNRFVGGLCYADDIPLLPSTVQGLHKMVIICQDIASDYSITFNSSKALRMCLERMPECS